MKIRDIIKENQPGVAEGLSESVNDYLWHGSRNEHKVLYPQQAKDTGGKEESNKNAVYATPNAKFAIAMGLTTPGSDFAHFPNDSQGVLFSGNLRKGEMVYLHKVPKDLFIKHNGREWYSKPGVSEVKPIEVVTVPVDKYLNLIRQATPQDWKLRQHYLDKAKTKKQGVAEDLILNEGIIDFISKSKDKFLRLKDALSDEWAQSKEMWRIVQKGNIASQKEINFANTQFKDILRVVGLAAWYSLPIPGNTLLILATEKLLNKIGMSIIPDKIRNQVLTPTKQGVAEGSEQYYAIVHKVNNKPLSTHRNLESAKDEWRGLDQNQRQFYKVVTTKKAPKDWSMKEQGVSEGSSDYFRRREREEAIISGQKPARKKQPAQTSDYAKRREQEKKQGVSEGTNDFSRNIEAFRVYQHLDPMEFYNFANTPRGLQILAQKAGTTPESVKDSLERMDWGQFPADFYQDPDDDEQGVTEGTFTNLLSRLKGVITKVLAKKLSGPAGSRAGTDRDFQRMMAQITGPVDSNQYARLWAAYKSSPRHFVSIQARDIDDPQKMHLWASSLTEFLLDRYPDADPAALSRAVTGLVQLASQEALGGSDMVG